MITLYVQSPTLYLAGSGIVIGATSATVTDLVDIYGNVLTMADFGSFGYITFEPDTANAEAGTFTGITANANGTYTLTGLKSVLAKSPYTETSGSVRNHAGGTKVVVTDNVAFWNTFVNKNNDSTVVGQVTFPNGAKRPVLDADTDTATAAAVVTYGQLARTAIAGGAAASTTLLGYVKVSTDPVSALSPVALGENDTRVPTQGENDALVGNNTDVAVGTGNKMVTQTGLQHGAEKYVLCASGSSTAYTGTYSPAPTSITNGMEFFLKIDVANTTTNPTFNPNGLGAKTIVKGTSTALVANDLIVGQVARFVYDGTNMVLQNPATGLSYSNGTTTKNAADASGSQTIAHGLGVVPKRVRLLAILSQAGASAGDMNTCIAETVYNGTTQSSVSAWRQSTGQTTYGATFTLNAAGTDSATQSGVVTVDSTNITVTWTKTGSPTGTYNILWEANS